MALSFDVRCLWSFGPWNASPSSRRALAPSPVRVRSRPKTWSDKRVQLCQIVPFDGETIGVHDFSPPPIRVEAESRTNLHVLKDVFFFSEHA